MIGLGLDIWRGVKGVGGASGPPPPPALAVSPTELWVYDASIGNGICNAITLGSEFVIGTNYFKQQHGLTLKVVQKSVAGQTLTQIAARFAAEKAAVAGRPDILVWTMPIGNSISGRWDAKSQVNKDALIAEYYNFTQNPDMSAGGNNGNSIVAAGATLMPVNTSWRNTAPESLIDEANGSAPYNEAVIWPVAQSATPSMWFDGKPFANLYEFMRRYFSMLADDRHPTNPQGYHMMRTFAFDTVAARIKGNAPPQVPRYADPTAYQAKPVVAASVVFATLSVFAKSSTVYSALTAGSTATGTTNLLAFEGFTPNGMTITLTAAKEGSGTNGTTFNTGDISNSLLNDGFKANYWFTTSATPVEAFRIGGLTPGQQVRFDILAMRSATGDVRRGVYSVDGGVTNLVINATYSAGQTPTPGQLIGTADGNGDIIFTYGLARPGTDTNAYLNGVILTPL